MSCRFELRRLATRLKQSPSQRVHHLVMLECIPAPLDTGITRIHNSGLAGKVTKLHIKRF